jgi:hypothetical protein
MTVGDIVAIERGGGPTCGKERDRDGEERDRDGGG